MINRFLKKFRPLLKLSVSLHHQLLKNRNFLCLDLAKGFDGEILLNIVSTSILINFFF